MDIVPSELARQMQHVFPLGTKAFSYIRMSRPEQLRGDSLRRQLEGSRKFSDEHGLELDESLRDIGVSGYTGANRVKGALGEFLKLVESGRVPRGSVLIIESIDRFSREEATRVLLGPFADVINAGIAIVTLIDRQVYSHETLKGGDAVKLIMVLVTMIRANEESASKSDRLRAAYENKRRKAREHNTPVTGRCPEWLKLIGGKFKIIEDRVSIIKRIFEECASGLGDRVITTRLNKDGILAFRGKLGWNNSSVAAPLTNEAVIGIYQPHRRVNGKRIPEGEAIPGYYPTVIDEALYWRAKGARQGRQRRVRVVKVRPTRICSPDLAYVSTADQS